MRRELARLSRSTLITEYYSWLCDLIRVNQPNKSYWLLAKALHARKFEWSVPNDDNRAYEGKNLRERFCEETDTLYIDEYLDSDCSMLELIIALAYRCESTMADQDASMPMREWFWLMMENVGLDLFTDSHYYHHGGDVCVDEILERIIKRTYQRNGRGGLFPLKFCKKNQRKVELWYQMSSYLVENFYTDDVFV